MGVGGKPVVHVLFDAVMCLARQVGGIDVDDDQRQVAQVMQQLVADFHADLTALDGDLAANRPELHFVPLAQVASSIQY